MAAEALPVDEQLLGRILRMSTTRRAQLAILRALYAGGERSRNVLDGLAARYGDAKGQGLDALLRLRVVVQRGRTKGTVYDLSPRARAAAARVPSIVNP